MFISRVERLLCTAAGPTCDGHRPGAARPRLGTVSFLHRIGSALNHHVHLHVCATDGVFVPTGDGRPAFLPARPITQAALATLTEKVRPRVGRWFCMQRLLDADAAADMVARENSRFSVAASVRIAIFFPGLISEARCEYSNNCSPESSTCSALHRDLDVLISVINSESEFSVSRS